MPSAKRQLYNDDYDDHVKNNKCLDRVTLTQEGPTCWFNAVMTALLYSDGMRELIIKNMHKMSKSSAQAQIEAIIKNYFTHENPKDIEETYKKARSVLKPVKLLDNLHKEDPLEFMFNPNVHEGFSSRLYINRLLNYLHIKDYLYLDKDKNDMLYYSTFNNVTRVEKEIGKPLMKFAHILTGIEVQKEISKTPKVLFILNGGIATFLSHYATNQKINLTPVITYNNTRYKLDSMILANFNDEKCSKRHEIAGITCKGDRYLYNGWIAHTKDKSKTDDILAKVPCSFIKHDWMDTSKGDFCLDTSRCFINYGILDKHEVCFSYSKGDKTYLYIRIDDDDDDKNTPKKHEKIKSPLEKKASTKHEKIKSPLEKKASTKHERIKSPLEKKASKKHEKTKCPPEKLLNPASGRCVNKDGKIGKQLLKDEGIIKTKTPEKKAPKHPKHPKHPKQKCPPEKILNPASGRCVNRTGKIGKTLGGRTPS